MAEDLTPPTPSSPQPAAAVAAREPEFDATLAFAEEQAGQSPLAENLQQLPSFVSRGLIYLIFSFLGVGLIYSAIAKVPVIRSARGAVAPVANLQQIQADCDGVIRKVEVSERDLVNEGKLLVEIDSREVVTHLTALRLARQKIINLERDAKQLVPLKQEQIQSQIEVLHKKRQGVRQTLLDLKRRQLDLTRNRDGARRTRELEKSQEQEELLREQLDLDSAMASKKLAIDEHKSSETLKLKKAITELQWRAAELALENAETKVRRGKSLLDGARKSQEISAEKYAALELGFEQSAAELVEDIGQNEISLESIVEELAQKKRESKLLEITTEQELEHAQFEFQQARDAVRLSFPGIDDDELDRLLSGDKTISNRTLLRAPHAGRIGKLLVRNPGETVSRGQPLMTLIPSGGGFRVEVRVANRDVGLLKPDMRVRLKFDAFPHTEHGILEGTLEKIVPDPEGDSNGGESFYRGYVTLDQECFHVGSEEIPL
ncbi:MAG: HlyD family efflux transporter periplasmic adaptor subunit, partial [Planctomycetota bacterium]|nr:HlyD family efflux transporter periplasmic adaptor subunit [Planctomycetota bacterium]